MTWFSLSYKPSEFTATFPAASGDLPFRHEWLMLTQAKFESPEVATEFQKMVQTISIGCFVRSLSLRNTER